MKHQQQAEAIEDVEQARCPEDVEKHIDSRWDFNSCSIGQLGEAQPKCPIIRVATKLAHGRTHGKHHNHDWHKLTAKNHIKTVSTKVEISSLIVMQFFSSSF